MNQPHTIYDKARDRVLADLRGLWTEAKAAQLQGETARIMAEGVLGKVEELAARIKAGDLDPSEALALLESDRFGAHGAQGQVGRSGADAERASGVSL